MSKKEATNPYKVHKGLKRVYLAFLNSTRGFYFVFREESAFRQELFLVILSGIILFFVSFTLMEKLLIIISSILILICEIINSAIEAAIDRISFSNHDLSMKAKDYGSAAVLLSIVIFILCWSFPLFN